MHATAWTTPESGVEIGVVRPLLPDVLLTALSNVPPAVELLGLILRDVLYLRSDGVRLQHLSYLSLLLTMTHPLHIDYRQLQRPIYHREHGTAVGTAVAGGVMKARCRKVLLHCRVVHRRPLCFPLCVCLPARGRVLACSRACSLPSVMTGV